MEKAKNIDYARLFRGADAESWGMFSKTEKDKKFKSLKLPLRIGHFHLCFEKVGSDKMYIIGTLILEQDWNKNDLNKLIQELNYNFADAERREDFLCHVYFVRANKMFDFADTIKRIPEGEQPDEKGTLA